MTDHHVPMPGTTEGVVAFKRGDRIHAKQAVEIWVDDVGFFGVRIAWKVA